jgi:hypothetical protein
MMDFKKRQAEIALDDILKLVRQIKDYAISLQTEVRSLRLNTIRELKENPAGNVDGLVIKSDKSDKREAKQNKHRNGHIIQ